MRGRVPTRPIPLVRTVPPTFRGAATWFAAFVACALGSPLPSQQQATNVDAALQRWEQSLAKGEKDRAGALVALAAFDDPRVTDALVAAMKRFAKDPFGARVADAIGQKQRPQAFPALEDAFKGKDASPQLQNAVARALGKQGNRGIDFLVDVAQSELETITDAMRQASRAGLAACNEDRAWRGLAPLALKGNKVEQLAVLQLLAPAKNVKAVTQVRVKLLQESDDVLAATAWRQLAAEGYARAGAALEDLVSRMGSSPPAAARAELVNGMSAGLFGLAPEEFLRLAASPAGQVQTALQNAAAGLAKDAGLLAFLVAAAREREDSNERLVALTVVSKATVEALAPHVASIRAGLQKPTRDAVELALATMPALSKDPKWKDDVRRLLETSDPELRTTGLALLLDLGISDAVAIAQKQIDAEQWALRSVAYRYLTKFRDLSSMPLLIARFGKETGRLEIELAEALFVHAGVRCWTRDDWSDWWKQNGEGHALPRIETVTSSKKKNQGGGSTASYFGIPLVSRKCVFLVDASGSMGAKIGTDKKRTRYDEVRTQLYNAVEKLPDDQLFNICFYSSGVNPMWPELRSAKGDERKQVLDRIKASNFTQGSTNIFDSLERSFGDAQIDTVYLLSDGEPSAGRITDATQIADLVRRWNYGRQVVIHCVSVGANSKFLERLARESGGEYVFVR